MIQVVYSHAAENDLIGIYLYSIENFGEKHALEYEQGLKNRFSQLALNPRLGVDLSEYGIKMRKLVFRAHIIYYSIDGDVLQIGRVLDARQDPLRHL